MDDFGLASHNWTAATRELKRAVEDAERAVEQYPSPPPDKWVRLLLRLTELVEEFEQG